MYTPRHLHPKFNSNTENHLQSRWKTPEGLLCLYEVKEMIREGGGEDFLQMRFERGELSVLEDMNDLRGLLLMDEHIVFPSRDNFQGINFSYAQIYYCSFAEAVFHANFEFANLANCTFKNCFFHYNSFDSTNMERCRFENCKWIEDNSFINCSLKDVTFKECFFGEMTPFEDCKFDDLVEFESTKFSWDQRKAPVMAAENHSEFYASIAHSYDEGDAIKKAKHFLLLTRQAYTRHNTKGLAKQFYGLLQEYVTGYGLRPGRVLLTMGFVLTLGTLGFWTKMPLADSLVFVTGALFTFGASADKLASYGLAARFSYIFLAFFGVSLNTVFITTLSNAWFNARVSRKPPTRDYQVNSPNRSRTKPKASVGS